MQQKGLFANLKPKQPEPVKKKPQQTGLFAMPKPAAKPQPKAPKSEPVSGTAFYEVWQTRGLERPSEGRRVLVVTEEYGELTGEITYIDWRTFHLPHFFPVQLLLDKPYDSSEHRMLRVSFNQVKEYLDTPTNL